MLRYVNAEIKGAGHVKRTPKPDLLGPGWPRRNMMDFPGWHHNIRDMLYARARKLHCLDWKEIAEGFSTTSTRGPLVHSDL